MPKDDRRFRVTIPGYEILECTEDGGTKPFFRANGCVYDDVPDEVLMAIQNRIHELEGNLLKDGAEAFKLKKGKAG